MIETEITFGDEEYRVLTDLALKSPKRKPARIVFKVILILLGVVELGCGISGIVSHTTWLIIFGFVVAAAALFLGLGGDRVIARPITLARTKKLNENVGCNTRRYTFDENQMTIASDLGNGTSSWDIFADYGESGHYLWLRRKDYLFVLVDMDKLSETDRTLLKQYCAKNIQK